MPAEPVPAGFNWDLFQGPAPRRPFLAARRGWRGWYAYGGGGITDWGVHLVDVMAWFMKLDNKAPLLTSASAQYVGQTPRSGAHAETYAVTWQFENFVATLSNAMIPGGEQPEENYGNWFHGNRGVMLVNRFGYDIRPVASGGGRGGGRGRGDGGRGGRGDAGAAAARRSSATSTHRAEESVGSEWPIGSPRHGVRLRHQASRPQLSRQRQIAAETRLRYGSRFCGLAPVPARQRGDSAGAHREVEREQGDIGVAVLAAFARALGVRAGARAGAAKHAWEVQP